MGEPAEHMRPRRAAGWLIVAFLVALVPVLSIHSHLVKSATFDETLALGAGLRMVRTGDVAVPVDYGPLVRWMAASAIVHSDLPLSLTPERIPWSPHLVPEAYQRVLYLENDADRLLLRARLAMLPFHLLLVLAVFGLSWMVWGRAGAPVSLAFAVLSPTVLAHGRLVTNDVAVSALLAATFFFVLRLARRATLADLALAGVSLGLALLAKFSALFAVPVLALIFGARAASGVPWPAGALLGGLRRRWTLALAALVGLGGVACFVVWAFYGFRYATVPASDASYAAKQQVIEDVRAESVLESRFQQTSLDVAERLRVLPEPYLLAVRYTLKHMERRLAFFMGERSLDGFRAYFPFAFALKTPIATQLALLGVLVALATRRLALDRTTVVVLAPFPLLYLAYAMSTNIQLGQRYLLPIYPFLFVLLGGLGVLAARSWRVRGLLAGALAWVAFSTLAIHPDYLAYFNGLAGGPRGGIRYLGGSNLDWGQDLRRLGPWLEEHDVEHVKLGYFGTPLPEYYGFSFDRLEGNGYLNTQPGTKLIREGDWLAVSATCRQGFFFPDMATYDFLDQFIPVHVIGHTIYIYEIDRARLISPGDVSATHSSG